MAEVKAKKFLVELKSEDFTALRRYLIEVGATLAEDRGTDEGLLMDLFFLSPTEEDYEVWSPVYPKVKETGKRKFLIEFTGKHFRDIEKMLKNRSAKIKVDEDVVRGMFYVSYEGVEALDLKEKVTIRKVT